MCRNIKAFHHHFDFPVTVPEIYATSLQFIRKVTGTTHPSKMNEKAFNKAAEDIFVVVERMFEELVTSAAPRNRRIEVVKV